MAPLFHFGVGGLERLAGWSVSGPTVGASAALQKPRQGNGGGRLLEHFDCPGCLSLLKFDRSMAWVSLGAPAPRRAGALSLGAVKARLLFSCDSPRGGCAAHRRPHPPLQSQATRCCSSKPQFSRPSCNVGGKPSLCCAFKFVSKPSLKSGVRFQGASHAACFRFIEPPTQDWLRRSNSICRFSIHKSHLTLFMRHICVAERNLISFYLNAF